MNTHFGTKSLGHRLSQRGICVAALLLWLVAGCSAPTSAEKLRQARRAVAEQNPTGARELLESIPVKDEAWGEAQVFLAEIAQGEGRIDQALERLAAVPRDGSPISATAQQALADLHFGQRSLYQVADCLEYVVRQQPDNFRAQTHLAYAYSRCGLRYRAQPYLLVLVQKGYREVKDLVMLTAPERRGDEQEFLRQASFANPTDALIGYGLAQEEFEDKKFDDAERRLRNIVLRHPEFAEAQALLGELLLDGDLPELQDWHSRLPFGVQNHPQIWYVRGLWARRLNQSQVAARSFWETIRQNPIHQRAMYQLGQVMSQLDPAVGAEFTERAARLKEVADRMEMLLIRKQRDIDNLHRFVDLLLDMGRDWEAFAWVAMIGKMVEGADWHRKLEAQLAYVPDRNPPRFLPEKNLALRHPLTSYPDFASLGLSQVRPHVPVANRPTPQIRFVDQATALGIEFTYYQSSDPKSHSVRIFESTGGGVGVLDLDLDGRPDCYLTQGLEWPRGEERPISTGRYRDRLYWNRGTRFQDVTDEAGLLVDEGYGQGISAGDFNNDGFPDLYVANIGGNRLLQNNGDGTFADVTTAAGISGTAWTTSCLILDLNADGQPDLYDVNYLEGDRIYVIECEASSCSVRDYRGAPDRVQLSRGDGTFVTVPLATPQLTAEQQARGVGNGIGKGLGIVSLFLDGETKPSLFIGNDQVPNFFLRPTDQDGVFTDAAVLSGLAVNRFGQTTASMGIAAGDLNHDRLVDLFVTNFEGEGSTLFVQRQQGFFEDAIAGTGLMAAGMSYVGWGAQCLDADNDGELDFVVTNGHIANFGKPGVLYYMPTQFFRNAGELRFLQGKPAELGPLFERKILGRSIATLDWNRDGRTDFILSSLEVPVAVATNETDGGAHFIDIRLHGRTLARDAIGAQVEIRQAGATHWQQLLAGDGYQVTNERQLHFGLPRAEPLEALIVHWPGGGTSSWSDVPVDTTVEIVEGAERCTLWKGDELLPGPSR
ncbi:MAG: VCBS repeat-containing protein [Planctomycetes bacterium]|nr:VCBS repeat-containing protein [Planctomycetota bacterium]